MALFANGLPVNLAFLGDRPAVAVWIGDTMVWPQTEIVQYLAKAVSASFLSGAVLCGLGGSAESVSILNTGFDVDAPGNSFSWPRGKCVVTVGADASSGSQGEFGASETADGQIAHTVSVSVSEGKLAPVIDGSALSVSILNTGLDVDSPSNSASWVGGAVSPKLVGECVTQSGGDADRLSAGVGAAALSVSILNTAYDFDSPSNSFSWLSGVLVLGSAGATVSESLPGGGTSEQKDLFGATVSDSIPGGGLGSILSGADALSVSILNTGVDVDSPSNSFSWIGGGAAPKVAASAVSESAGTDPATGGVGASALSVSILNTTYDFDSASNSFSWVGGGVQSQCLGGSTSESVPGGGTAEQQNLYGASVSDSVPGGGLVVGSGAGALSVSVLDTGVDVDSPSNSFSWLGGGVSPRVSGNAVSESDGSDRLSAGVGAPALSVSVLNTTYDFDSPSNSYSWIGGAARPVTVGGTVSDSVPGGSAQEAGTVLSDTDSQSVPGGGVGVRSQAAALSVSILDTGVDVDSPSNSVSVPTAAVMVVGVSAADAADSSPGGALVAKLDAPALSVSILNTGVDVDSPSNSFSWAGGGVSTSLSASSVSDSVPGGSAEEQGTVATSGNSQSVPGGGVGVVSTSPALSVSILNTGVDVDSPSNSISVPSAGVTVINVSAAAADDSIPAATQTVQSSSPALSVSILNTGVDVDSPSNSFSWIGGGVKPIQFGELVTVSADGEMVQWAFKAEAQSRSVLNTTMDFDSPSNSYSWVGGGIVPRSVGASESASALNFVSSTVGGASSMNLTSFSDATATLGAVLNEGSSSSDSIPDSNIEISMILQVDVSQTVNIPSWARKVDALVVGSGAGASSSANAATTWGRGGGGGVWAYNEYVLESLLNGSGADRFTAVFTIGTGGPGGTAPALGLGSGSSGNLSRVVINAVTGGASRALATLTGAGGAANPSTTGGTEATDKPGKPVTGGNANAGKDVSLHPPLNINGAIQQVYSGGAQQTNYGGTGLSAGNPPGGGAAGRNIGGGQVGGSPGANGRGFIRFYSGQENSQQLSWKAAGSYSNIGIPLTTDFVYPLALGGGGGGAGGQALSYAVAGEGGGGGYWNYVKTAPFYWDITQLLAGKGYTRSDITKLWIDVTVGRGGSGGSGTLAAQSSNNGSSGLSSQVILNCRTNGGLDVQLAVLSGPGGNGGVNSPFTSVGGKAVTAGNATSGRDMRFVFQGRSFAVNGGDSLPGGLGVSGSSGNAPGGGGSGGRIGAPILAGGDGYSGAAGAVYVFTA